ncbi:MAG: DUF2125 domain-containing protein [Paracoccaceae bacterium]
MRKLLFLVILAASLWGGYWFIGASAKNIALTEWFKAQNTRGWTAQYDTLAVRGFPNRFDTTITDYLLENPYGRWGLQGEALEIAALSYKPNHAIISFQGQQTLSTPQMVVRLNARQLRASMVVEPSIDLTLERLRLEAANMEMRSGTGWQGAFDFAYLAFENVETRPLDYRFGLSLSAFNHGIRWQGTPPDLPRLIQSIAVDSITTYDAPWDRLSFETRPPRARHISLQSFALQWGDLGITAQGEVDILADGTLDGEISLRIENVRLFIAALRAGGVLEPNLTGGAIAGLTRLAARRNSLTLPLRFTNRRTRLGPIDLGPAPQMNRR